MPPTRKKTIDPVLRDPGTGEELPEYMDEEVTDYTKRGELSQAQKAAQGYVTEPTVYPRPPGPRATCPHCGGIL